VAVIALASLLFSVAMGWWPARGAAQVPVAEALRYE
jgi:ABC-type lipoprotein release transport system permease subunit